LTCTDVRSRWSPSEAIEDLPLVLDAGIQPPTELRISAARLHVCVDRPADLLVDRDLVAAGDRFELSA
jgi:hypothetical protein